MKRAALALAATALVAGAIGYGCAADRAPSAAPELAVRAQPVEIAPARLDGLRLRGTVVLSADHPEFGGLSGLLVRDGRLIAVTDRGWLLEAALSDGPDGLRPAGASLLPILAGGRPLGKAAGDAESLAATVGGLAIGFERDHRIDLLADGRLREWARDRRFERLGGNEGLEGLAALPGGRLLAIAEAPSGGAFPAFLVGPDGSVRESGLPQHGPHHVTGADVGPDGRLYVLRRDFSVLSGVSIRVERYRLAEDGLPDPDSRSVLAEFESASGIDNMEGIALWRDAGGRARLTLVSDDNFNPLQRTLLMDFEIVD